MICIIIIIIITWGSFLYYCVEMDFEEQKEGIDTRKWKLSRLFSSTLYVKFHTIYNVMS